MEMYHSNLDPIHPALVTIRPWRLREKDMPICRQFQLKLEDLA